MRVAPKITDASGNAMATQGVFDIQFIFDGKLCHGLFVVSSAPSHSILGMNVISEYNMVLDPVRNTVGIPSAPPLPVCELSNVEESAASAAGVWLVQVAEATVVEPGTSAKVRCRLVHPETREPLLVLSQFFADMELFDVAATSNENGSFKPHMPNNDVVCKQFSGVTF